ncbi:MAG: polymer-forming cytoskeletal protein [Caldilineaceae bacterium]|nr:polymer-forming cytoskeletal protein [Caldilineaceae bacterium]
MFGRMQRPAADAIEVIIGPRASFMGELRSDTSIRIDGAVEGGRIETAANVILTETARAQCDIWAKTVSIRGFFRGVIRADRVELLDGSQVYGALHVNSIFMDEGVLLRAELNLQGAAVEDAGVQPRPDTSTSIPVVTPTSSPRNAAG